jgi:ArsR family transcriptional regulator
MPIFMVREAGAPADGETLDQLGLMGRVFCVTRPSPRRRPSPFAGPLADKLVPAAPVLPSADAPGAVKTTAAPGSTAEPLAADQAQRLLRALAEPIRLQLLQALQHGERCVCELTSDLDLAQSKLSFHLKVLKQAGLICARQEGRWIYYRLDRSALLLLRDWLGQLAAASQSPATPCC